MDAPPTDWTRSKTILRLVAEELLEVDSLDEDVEADSLELDDDSDQLDEEADDDEVTELELELLALWLEELEVDWLDALDVPEELELLLLDADALDTIEELDVDWLDALDVPEDDDEEFDEELLVLDADWLERLEEELLDSPSVLAVPVRRRTEQKYTVSGVTVSGW
jgi:hypothetical protein